MDDRLDRLERDIDELRIRMADLAARIATLDRLARWADETQRRVDVQLDRFRAEQLAPEQIQQLLTELYRLGVRIPNLEERMMTLERQQAGDMDAKRID